MSNILILSEPIRSGKSTLLIEWCKQNKSVTGTICPDIAGKRKLYVINEHRLLPLEVGMGSAKNTIQIGRFIFNADSFIQAHKSLLDHLNSASAYLLIDEVGKLEMEKNEGFEPALTLLIDHYKKKSNPGKLILVIRDYLLGDAVIKYGLQDATIIKMDFFEQQIYLVEPIKNYPVNALILCGGNSSRMGSPKALLKYHDKPQYKVVFDLLKPYCKSIFLSCKQEQERWFEPGIPLLFDDDAYTQNGPIAALLSACKNNMESGFVLIGCDYPALKPTDINLLVQTGLTFNKSCCYVNNDDLEEPFLAYYHPNDLKLLDNFYLAGQYSLSRFLKSVNTVKIIAEDPRTIKSYDTTADFKLWA